MSEYIPIQMSRGKCTPMDIVFWYRDNNFTLEEAKKDAGHKLFLCRDSRELDFQNQVMDFLQGV